MQVKMSISENIFYSAEMAGRPATKPAPPFGERLAALRKERGWTQPQLAERLKPRHPAMKVLFVSGYRHDALDQKGLLGRGVQVLPKPFPPAQFIRQVQLLLRQEESLV